MGLVGVWTGFLDGVDFVHNSKVQNVDSTPNKSSEIWEAVNLLVNNNGQKASHAFFVANIG